MSVSLNIHIMFWNFNSKIVLQHIWYMLVCYTLNWPTVILCWECFVRSYWKVQTPVKNKQTCVSIQQSPLAHLQWWLITGQPGVSVPKLTVHMSSIDGWKQLRYTTTRHCVRHQQQTHSSNNPNENPFSSVTYYVNNCHW